MINLQEIDAVIFDMDGLLIDSEPLWQEAEIAVFAQVGIKLSIENCLETTGLPTRDVIEYWYRKKPWKGISKQNLEKILYQKVIHLIKERAAPMPGVVASLEFFKSKGKKIGLASASPMPIIEASLESCQIKGFFDVYHSGTLEDHNKPDPALYHTVAANLQCSLDRCIILEDSGNGIKGAINTPAIIIAVPAGHEYEDTKFDEADYKLSSLIFFPRLLLKE